MGELDEVTIKKCASLAAYGFGDQQIADTLIISVEAVAKARETEVFKRTFADKSYERTQAAIDLTEGWDSVEAQGIATVLEALQWSKDPKFALAAATRANAAKRTIGQTARTIDPSKVGQVVHISFNAKFVQTAVKNENRIINAGTVVPSKTQKIVDMPTPTQVTDLLAPARPLLEKIKEHKLHEQFDALNFGNLDEKDE